MITYVYKLLQLASLNQDISDNTSISNTPSLELYDEPVQDIDLYEQKHVSSECTISRTTSSNDIWYDVTDTCIPDNQKMIYQPIKPLVDNSLSATNDNLNTNNPSLYQKNFTNHIAVERIARKFIKEYECTYYSFDITTEKQFMIFELFAIKSELIDKLLAELSAQGAKYKYALIKRQYYYLIISNDAIPAEVVLKCANLKDEESVIRKHNLRSIKTSESKSNDDTQFIYSNTNENDDNFMSEVRMMNVIREPCNIKPSDNSQCYRESEINSNKIYKTNTQSNKEYEEIEHTIEKKQKEINDEVTANAFCIKARIKMFNSLALEEKNTKAIFKSSNSSIRNKFANMNQKLLCNMTVDSNKRSDLNAGLEKIERNRLERENVLKSPDNKGELRKDTKPESSTLRNEEVNVFQINDSVIDIIYPIIRNKNPCDIFKPEENTHRTNLNVCKKAFDSHTLTDNISNLDAHTMDTLNCTNIILNKPDFIYNTFKKQYTNSDQNSCLHFNKHIEDEKQTTNIINMVDDNTTSFISKNTPYSIKKRIQLIETNNNDLSKYTCQELQTTSSKIADASVKHQKELKQINDTSYNANNAETWSNMLIDEILNSKESDSSLTVKYNETNVLIHDKIKPINMLIENIDYNKASVVKMDEPKEINVIIIQSNIPPEDLNLKDQNNDITKDCDNSNNILNDLSSILESHIVEYSEMQKQYALDVLPVYETFSKTKRRKKRDIRQKCLHNIEDLLKENEHKKWTAFTIGLSAAQGFMKHNKRTQIRRPSKNNYDHKNNVRSDDSTGAVNNKNIFECNSEADRKFKLFLETRDKYNLKRIQAIVDTSKHNKARILRKIIAQRLLLIDI